MTTTKVSAFPDGAPALSSDILGAVRGSGNVRFTVGDVRAIAPPRSIGIIGDSKASDFHAGTTSSENCHWNSQGGLGWYLARNGFPLDCPASFDGANPVNPTGNNRGVSGNTTTQMLARIQADAWDNNYDMLIIRGGTNDIHAGDTAATIIGNLDDMIDGTLDRGIVPVVHTVDQRTDGVGSSYWSNTNGGTTTAQKEKIYNQVNEYLRDKAVTTPGMILIDPEAYFTDPATGKLRTDFTPDGTHNSPLAGYWEGQVYEERLSGLVVPTSQAFFNILDLYDATYNPYGNILTNGELAGTGGTAGTGDNSSTGIATGVTISRSSGSTITYTASKGTLSYGNATFTTQNIKVTSDGSGSGVETIRARFGSSISTGLVGNAFYEMFGLMKVFAPTNELGLLLGANCQLKENSPSGAAVSSLRRYLAGSPWPVIEHPVMFMKTPPRKLVSNIVNITCDLLIDVDARVNDDITISFAMCQARRRRTSPATLS